MTDRKILPAASVPLAGYELLERYAAHLNTSISQVLRLICANSPELRAFASKDDLQAYFQVGEWGGDRRSKIESNDEE